MDATDSERMMDEMSATGQVAHVTVAGGKMAELPFVDTVTETVVLEAVRYDKETGLVPVVVQDVSTGAVLTLAYANREALKRTFGTGHAWFWSRSRQEYWQKGATSGNTQRVVDVRLDCDGDAVLYLVEPAGPACHTGAYTCFYRGVTHHGERPGEKSSRPESEVHASTVSSATVTPESAADGRPVVGAGCADIDLAGSATVGRVAAGEPSGAASGSTGGDALEQLWQVIQSRWESRPQGSYTTYLFEHGVDKVAKKVGEESAEVILAAKNATSSGEVGAIRAGQSELAQESADLLFHLFALWKVSGIEPETVYGVLRDRAGK